MCASVWKAGSGVVDCVCVSGKGGEWSGSLSVRQWGRRGVEWLTVCASLWKAGSGVVDCVCVSGEGGEWSG